eukprot:554835-Rhodomonas_salina.2
MSRPEWPLLETCSRNASSASACDITCSSTPPVQRTRDPIDHDSPEGEGAFLASARGTGPCRLDAAALPFDVLRRFPVSTGWQTPTRNVSQSLCTHHHRLLQFRPRCPTQMFLPLADG